MIIYFFDLKAPNLQRYNTLKRRFYYHLGRALLAESSWKTKSVLAVPNKLEKHADCFFKKWRGVLLLYKIKTKRITRIL
ncbi:MAG: hypothetical protein AB1468_02725 [Candidatus Micrarchaeota archaeon]